MKIICALFCCVSALILQCTPGSAAETAKLASQAKIGTYDSRAVAVAFAGSAAHRKWLAPIMAEHEAAKKAGDNEQAKKISERMAATQKLRHQQAFSTAPIDDILANIEPGLARIKQQTGLVAIVSKWDEAALKKYTDAQKVDVTPQLIDEFHPTEQQRKHALDIQKQKPIPLSSIKD